VPTVAEAGIPGFEFTGWLAAFAPAGTPRGIVDKLQGELARILAMPDIQARFPLWGYEPVGSTPDALAAKLRADIRKYADAIKEAGIPRVD
jgi:tripartite-type tricarboxylate transporter receptor subunit TctC